MQFKKGQFLQKSIANEIMVNIIQLVVKNSIYYWTLLRCVNKLWKKYIDKCIKKPDYCVFRMLYCENQHMDWIVWDFSQKYKHYKQEKIKDAVIHFEKNSGRTFDHRMILFIFMSPNKDELTKSGFIKKKGDVMDNIHKYIVDNIYKTKKGEDIDSNEPFNKITIQLQLYPRQYYISLDQYNDIKKKDSTLLKMIQNARNL